MSITPTDTTVLPIAAGSSPSGTTTATGAGDFLAAILQALAPGTGTGTGTGTAPTGDVATAEPEAPATDAAALGLVVPPGLAAQLVPAPVVADGAGAGAGSGSGAADAASVVPGPANVAAGAEGAPTSPSGDIRMSGDVVPTAVATEALPTPAQTPTATSARGAEGGSPDRADAGPATPDPSAVTATGAAGQGTADTSGSAPDTSALPAPTAVSAPTAPAVARTEPAAASAPQHVTRQVFPEVTRLVSRGDGTHRITLDLNPESLGEVRVVMTVRDGAVHVRFAAGHEAGRALLDGSAELNRLLGAAGASETRIVVRELSAASQQTTGGATDSSSTGVGLGLGPGGDRSQDQHAGTRAEHHATDGSETTTPGTRGTGANPPRSSQPVTRARTAGVDVTM